MLDAGSLGREEGPLVAYGAALSEEQMAFRLLCTHDYFHGRFLPVQPFLIQ